MSLPFYNWSKVAANNANADSTVNWNEGQSPSSVNDSARAMMASTAAFRDDIAGAIVTAGTSTAYTVSSYQVFDTLAHLAGQMIAFTPHTTQTGTCTLNVDGLGAKPLRSAPSVELQSGTLIQGTPYTAVYNSTDSVFYLHGFFGNPYNIPLAGGMLYWGSVVPNSSFAFPVGQAISRTTYASLFSIMGTAHGAGDGSTTFNLPDQRGRVPAMIDSGAGRLSSVGLNGNLPVMGGAGGTESHSIAQANLPSVNFAVSNGSLSVNSTVSDVVRSTIGTTSLSGTTGGSLGAFASSSGNQTATITSTGTVSGQTAASGGSGTALPTQPPTICCNYIIRII
jgi:microcystin-dependent protein